MYPYLKNLSSILSLTVVIVGLSGCDKTDLPEPAPKADATNMERLSNIDHERGTWLTGGRDHQQSYYSPLNRINKNNANQLGFAWQYDIDTTQGFKATPIVEKGVMYSSGPMGTVYALDAKTGKEHWTFTPNIDLGIMNKICCGVGNRGVAVWQGKVYVGSLDGYLYALNADTGAVEWKADTITDRKRGYSITGAPYIANQVVVIGNGGSEFDARGYVTAYDVETGEQRWRFFTVPGRPDKGFEHPELEMAAKTWDPNSLWEVGLGGTAWDGMAYDPELNLLYVGTGNGDPHPRKLRSPAGGDNLFLSSILAINPDTGSLAWYYQTTPGDNWDYTATQKMILAELAIEGKTRKVIMQAPKNGFFYVLDRATGELLSAEPYAQINWASHVDKKTGRPVETGQGDYSREPKLVFPSAWGAHNWQPMAYNPNTGLVYIPTIEMPNLFALPDTPFSYQQGGANSNSILILPLEGPNGFDSDVARKLGLMEQLTAGSFDYRPRGFLKAWDPVKQKIAWQVETSGQWAGEYFAISNGGGLMTSAGGLVFQGRGDGNLVVLDAENGRQLHSIFVGTSMTAAPMTYSVDGEQYIAIMAGIGGLFGGTQPPGSASYKYGNKGRIVAFKLHGGEVPLPDEIIHSDDSFPKPPVSRMGTTAQLKLGKALYQRNCAKCHANAGGGIPNLLKMDAQAHREFLDIVLQGIRAEKGMGSFKGILSKTEAQAIHAYLVNSAWEAYVEDSGTSTSHQPERAVTTQEQ